jgi:hypothetical protein
MARVALVADDCRSQAIYLNACSLPDFYMEDFSIQGFAVQHYGDARDLLRRCGYTLLDKGNGAEIIIDHAGQIRDIRALFQENGIRAEFADIASTIYQA